MQVHHLVPKRSGGNFGDIARLEVLKRLEVPYPFKRDKCHKDSLLNLSKMSKMSENLRVRFCCLRDLPSIR